MIERRPTLLPTHAVDLLRRSPGKAAAPAEGSKEAELHEALEGLRTILNAMRPEEAGSRAGPDMLAFAKRMASERYRRFQYFDGHLFSDPAWDIMLELFVAELERREVPVTNLCFTSNVPDTTVLRWIKTLAHEGLLIRIKDEVDKRRVFVQLSEAASEAMRRYMEEQMSAAEKLRIVSPREEQGERRRPV